MSQAHSNKTSEEEGEIASLSRELGKRLRQEDSAVLKEIFERFSPAVLARLKKGFQHVLDESDLDDALQRALLRVWNYRDRYDPSRSSLYTWLYLIARSQALEIARKRAGEPRYFLSELSPAQRGALASESDDLSATTPRVSPELTAIQAFLARLRQPDREILLAFAEHAGDEAWAANLAEQWQMSASTLRSRKRRVMARLLSQLKQQGFETATGDTQMATIAPLKLTPAKPVPTSLPLQFEQCGFLQLHAPQVVELGVGMTRYFQAVQPSGSGQGFPHFRELWAQAIDHGDLQDPRQRQVLTDTYRWLQERASREDRFRGAIARFIDMVLQDSELAHSAFARASAAERIDRIETALAGLGLSIEARQPENVAMAGAGEVLVSWHNAEAQLRWEPNATTWIDLRSEAAQAFNLYGDYSLEVSAALADAFLANVHHLHLLLPPNFAFPTVSGDQAPDRLRWSLDEPTEAANDLPDWLVDAAPGPQELPSPLDQDLLRFDARVFELLDELLVQAALIDLQTRQLYERTNQPSPADSAVDQLVEYVAFASNQSRQEIAEMFHRSLRDRQTRVDGPQECGANTEALAFLWSHLAADA